MNILTLRESMRFRSASLCLLGLPLIAAAPPKIAVFSDPTATIQNSEALVTSDKARREGSLSTRFAEELSAIKGWGRARVTFRTSKTTNTCSRPARYLLEEHGGVLPEVEKSILNVVS